MRKTDTVQVFQTLGCTVQLSLNLSRRSSREREVMHQFQSVGVILADVLHDVPMTHPL